MAKNHYVTKRNRRPVSGKRKDTQRIADTMRKLREHAQAQEKAKSEAKVKEVLVPMMLKNGSQEVKAIVVVTMLSLRKLIEEQPIAFYELVMVSRNPAHQLFGDTGTVLARYELASESGHVHNSVRNVVISAVEGEGLDMVLRSPLVPTIDEQLEKLAQMKDEDIDTSDIPEVTDWSKAEIGKFYRG